VERAAAAQHSRERCAIQDAQLFATCSDESRGRSPTTTGVNNTTPLYTGGVSRDSSRQCSSIGYRVAQKSKPLPNDQKIVLNRIISCQ